MSQQMLSTHPQSAHATALDALSACIDACFACADTCNTCADACLGETEHLAHLVKCIRLNADCADICVTTGRVLGRLTSGDASTVRAQVQACQAACKACGDECAQHAEMGMQHCVICAEACRTCEQACQTLLGSLA